MDPATQPPELSLTVDQPDANQRLDQLLADPLGSRARAARLIEAGLVTVNGAAAQKRYRVRPGDSVEVMPQPSMPARWPASAHKRAGDAEYTVAFEDEFLLIVDKPAGVVVHPGRGNQEGTLAQALSDRAAGGDDPLRAGIVHRLDKDTSGLLVIAKSEEAHRALSEMIADREVTREYLALVDGTPPAHTGTIDAAIGRDRHDRVLMSIDTDTPREARTHFEVLESYPTNSLLKLLLDTGRTHQIRVHLQAIGHPVTGDSTYGGSVRYELERQFLHAARLEFQHPKTGERIERTSELPEDLARALQLARTGG